MSRYQGVYRQEGTRGVTWRAVVSAGTDPVTGKRRQLVRTFREEEEAHDWRIRTLASVLDGSYHEPSTEPLGDYLTRWLARREDLEALSRDAYAEAIRVHIAPALGHVPLGQLRPVHIQDLYDTYKGTSIPFRLHAILRPALARARRLGLINQDLTDGVTVTGRRQIRTGEIPRTWSAEQLARFLAAADDHRLGPLFRVLAATGMRLGEVLSLQWDDVDLAGAVVHVRRAKSRAGRRQITIDPDTVAVLRAHWQAQALHREALGPAWEGTGLIFPYEDGRRRGNRSVQHAMERILAPTALPRLTPHGLRHTHATLLLVAGRPVHYVSRRLGHANVSITLNTYAHVIPQTDTEDAIAYGQILRRAAATEVPAPDADAGAR